MTDNRITCPECQADNHAGQSRCTSCHAHLIDKRLINTTGRQRAVVDLQLTRLNTGQKAMLSNLHDVRPLLSKAADYFIAGQLTKAEELYRLALLWAARKHGPKSTRQLETLERLATVCLEQGHELQAEHTFRHAIGIIEGEHPLLYWRVFESGGENVLESYAYFLDSRDRPEEALRIRTLKKRVSHIYRLEVAVLAFLLTVTIGAGAYALFTVMQVHSPDLNDIF